MALGTDYIIKYLSDTANAVKGANDLDKLNAQIASTIGKNYANATRIIGTDLQKISQKPININGKEAIQTLQQVGTVVQMADGSFAQFTQTQTLVDGRLQKTTGSMKDVTGQFKNTNIETEKSGKFFDGLGKNLNQLVQRALLTIPVWLALRAVVTGTLSAIGNSFKALETQSLALQKAKQNLQGTTSEISRNFAALKTDTADVALATGVSQDKVITAFQKFATVGFDYKTSIESANNATKLSVILQGDAVETANAFARSMRVLIDTSKGAAPEAIQIRDAMSLMLEQWRTNAFEIGEFTQSLEKFAGTAKTMNFTVPQTIALLSTLSTAGLRGSQAGTLLKTSIQKLVENLDVLAGTVGVKFNKNLDSSFDVLVKVIDQIKILSETSKLAPEATAAIADIFGGVRGASPIRALISLREELGKNIALVPDIKKFNGSFEDSEKILGNLMNRFHEANSQLGKAFINAVIGGDNFNDSLEKIVTTLQSMPGIIKNVGEAIQTTFNIATGVVNVATLGQAGQIVKLFNLMAQQDKAQGNSAALGQKFGQRIQEGLSSKLKEADLSALISDLEVFGTNFTGLDNTTLKLTIDHLKTILSTTKEINIVQDGQKKTQDQIIVGEKDREEFAKLLITNELDKLKAMGASNSELLKATDLYNKHFGIAEKTLDVLGRQLERERAINDEKRLQSKLSSDAIKLFDIANTSGVQTAKNISDVLSGNTSFETFVRKGGQDLEVFKKEFADVFKQQQALAFFQGNRVPELPGLRGGTRIAETLPQSDQAVIQPVQVFIAAMDLAKEHAERLYKTISDAASGNASTVLGVNSSEAQAAVIARKNNPYLRQFTIEVNPTIPVTVDVTDLDSLHKQVSDKIAADMPKIGTQINQKLTEAQLGKQGNSL